MAAKNGKLVNFVARDCELKLIDEVRRKNYTLNQSDVLRLMMTEGAKALIGESAVNQIMAETNARAI